VATNKQLLVYDYKNLVQADKQLESLTFEVLREWGVLLHQIDIAKDIESFKDFGTIDQKIIKTLSQKQ
jgi:hypothetical protein